VTKAIDDRVGGYAELEITKQGLEYDTWVVCSVCEEIGGTGAAAAARAIDPGVLVNLEGTTAGDMPGVKMPHGSTEMRKGPAISLIDRGTVYPRELRDKMTAKATELGIRWQYRASANGGTDAGKVHIAASGCLAIGVSNPTRYIHCASSVAYLDDIEEMVRLTGMIIREAGECNV
jgi:endoglucanase